MSFFNAPNLNILWGTLLVEELIRNGIDYFVLSPGSRSTPLTVAIARHSKAKRRVCVDERGAAFHAIGYARATGNPAVLISTSGSAPANYFPAVIEASADRLPLIIISADRPPELRQTGANQTIDQVNLYGNYTRWTFDLPCPDESISPAVVLTTVDQLIYRSRRSPCGPVHLNCMFREPLAPTDSAISDGYTIPLKRWLNGDRPRTIYELPKATPTPQTLQQIAAILNETKRGILAIGALSSPREVAAISELAKRLQFPIFADIRSGLRLGNSLPEQIRYFDFLLSAEIWNNSEPIETVLQIGDRILSKRFLQQLEQHPPANYIVILDEPSRHDPTHAVTHRIESDIEIFCRNLSPFLISKISETWKNNLSKTAQKIADAIADSLTPESDLNEIAIAREVSRHIPPDSGLFLSNSMPVRDMDNYGLYGGNYVRIGANRGASGIDGIIASATGLCQGLNAPTTLIIGDLAFLHDLNSLSLVRSLPHPLWIIAINNNGGGIFSFLPISQFEDVFEPYFGTPQNLNFSHAAKLFDIEYFSPQTLEDFVRDYKRAIASQQSAILEVKTDRQNNRELHQKITQKKGLQPP
ncbi:2-succinyl-5-enolpyruvyl-6-hydroxy-3-cyclohexene-1-carboxylic-acid synthase [Lyngbya sp. CCY1209]|uniref:2-succinyl-5-enolpyruvyl-6-hydroxy-3- cyclohexene-1-carboxylic-acid synthase n=1 Tax=Lyngbya sp. CCY1209 TaxID=2886103 RepID=UPI002D212B6A|nr:2-succinyl-5-enolpyruvyl-6-hydroxy-3-cyclohexene-1-carboxylic-acid synthase [Lyngbya sp. CCY1209]MEB3884727.1 2-succinyl-5-enolpyruvyl-6-hydroxy-3-cyclohexene-1-carboxylic-acid synthase [Lyngbya sp. CCY1209]